MFEERNPVAKGKNYISLVGRFTMDQNRLSHQWPHSLLLICSVNLSEANFSSNFLFFFFEAAVTAQGMG